MPSKVGTQSVKILRERYPLFSYNNFSWKLEAQSLAINFDYQLGEHCFTPSVRIKGVSEKQIASSSPQTLDQLVFQLGLVEMLSYWKLSCAPKIEIKAGDLKQEQIIWWHDLLLQGMGEYFFVNKIDFKAKDFLSIRCTGELKAPSSAAAQTQEPAYLLLSSGGKDSALCLDLLHSEGVNFRSLQLNPLKAALDLAALRCDKPPIIIERTLDKHMLELNQQGYLNGHTPFSAYLAFAGTLVAQLFGFSDLVVCNERSSDQHNLDYLGEPINHQYSKSFEFERRFRQYAESYLPGTNFWSMLRPLHEIQVVGLLAQREELLSVFRSCNRRGKESTWCGECPKCLSTYLLFAAFLDFAALKNIFGASLMENHANLETLKALFAFDGRSKPFECVGTHDELVAASFLANRRGNLGTTELGKFIRYEILQKREAQELGHKLLAEWNPENFLPARFATRIRTELKSLA